MFFLRYPVEGGGGAGFLPVATTRPETVLGDAAVAVHPEDERFGRFVGRRCRVPLTDRRVRRLLVWWCWGMPGLPGGVRHVSPQGSPPDAHTYTLTRLHLCISSLMQSTFIL